jgi:hypothetical protein
MGVNVVNIAQGRGIGTRALISVGNECDVDLADLVAALADDEHTAVIALSWSRSGGSSRSSTPSGGPTRPGNGSWP